MAHGSPTISTKEETKETREKEETEEQAFVERRREKRRRRGFHIVVKIKPQVIEKGREGKVLYLSPLP